MAESATNTGDIVGKIDQHMGNHKSESGYKYQYVDVDKNKKLGLIHRGNVNSVLYNLLWDIVSHQVDNETARGEMKEVNWILKRFPKESDRDDDTGVSNETINKYVKKARDIISGMKPVTEDSVYVDNGKITKKSSDTAKKLNEEVNEDLGTPTSQSNQLTYKKEHDSTGDHWVVYNSDGVKVATYESEELAKKAVQGKGLNEEYNPFSEMIKDKDGKFTDGLGGSYKAPTEGTSKWLKKKSYKYRYNFKDRKLEIADNAGEIIYSSYLSLGNWLDNPEYWFDKAYKEIEDEEDAFLKDHFKKHPEDDKKNISTKDLKEEKVEEGVADDIAKACNISVDDAKQDLKEGIWTDKEIDEMRELAKKGYIPAAKKRSFINKLLNACRLEEEAEKLFSTAEDLDKYLSGKKSVVILYQDNKYKILDEESESEEEECSQNSTED